MMFRLRSAYARYMRMLQRRRWYTSVPVRRWLGMRIRVARARPARRFIIYGEVAARIYGGEIMNMVP